MGTSSHEKTNYRRYLRLGTKEDYPRVLESRVKGRSSRFFYTTLKWKTLNLTLLSMKGDFSFATISKLIRRSRKGQKRGLE